MQKNKIAVERGERLKREIKKRKLTQKAFAEILGISLSGLHYMLTGRSPINEITAYAIEHKFKIGSNYILHGTGKKKPKSEIINRLDQIYESLWSLDNQEQLMKTLNMFSDLIVKQTEHAEKQVDLLKRIEAHFDAQLEKPETEIRFS
jgi:transcriptional regulator with XRE-family HTH domain